MSLRSLNLLLVLCLCSCGPVLETRYDFTPPKGENGRSCIYNCENARDLCIQRDDIERERCESRAEADYRYCEDRIYAKKGRDPKWHECYRESCSTDYTHCEEDYRRCYRSCGGKVSEETVCVSNCEKLTPEQRKSLEKKRR